jgi:hypothetical protein
MKTFEERKKELILKIYLDSEFGTMYYCENFKNNEMAIIRHFDREVSPEFIPLYVQLYKEVQNWINNKVDIKEHVFLPDLVEIGIDYIIRSFYSYFNGVRYYCDDEEPIAPPIEYYGMLNTVSYELSEEYEEEEYVQYKENIIHRIIRKSLLGSTSKTFFDPGLEKFIIVEPKISLTDLEEWKKIVESKESKE